MSNASRKPNERRKRFRLNIRVAANIKFEDGSRLKGRTSNIGFNGAFFECQPWHNTQLVGKKCDFTLILIDEYLSTTITFKSSIRHINDKGVGLRFDYIYPEGRDDFINLMVENCDNQETILAEIRDLPCRQYHRNNRKTYLSE